DDLSRRVMQNWQGFGSYGPVPRHDRFCLLSFFNRDNSLLGDNQTCRSLGRCRFFVFTPLPPIILIVFPAAYPQIFGEHGDRLDRLSRRMPVLWVPTLLLLKNPLTPVFGGLTFYLLLPVTMVLFAWKAAVLPSCELLTEIRPFSALRAY